MYSSRGIVVYDFSRISARELQPSLVRAALGILDTPSALPNSVRTPPTRLRYVGIRLA